MKFCKDCAYLKGDMCANPLAPLDYVSGEVFLTAREVRSSMNWGEDTLQMPLCGPDALWFEAHPKGCWVQGRRVEAKEAARMEGAKE